MVQILRNIQMISHLDSKLHKMKADERRNRVSPDTVAMICGNLLWEFLIIVAYEQKLTKEVKGIGVSGSGRKSRVSNPM